MDEQTLVNILVEIAELEGLRAQAEQKIAANSRKTKNLAELQAEYEADALEADQLASAQSRDLRAVEREIKEVESRLSDRDSRLIGVSDRRQHRALQEEISGLKARLSRLEEEALGFLEAEEEGQKLAADAGDQSLTSEQKTAQASRQLNRESREMEDRLGHIETEMHRLLSMLPVDRKRTVQRLQEKLEQSVVFLHNEACSGCFNQLPAQEAINVNRGRKVVTCPSCMRFVVHRPWN